jgi:probable DNA repair protein
LPGQTSQQLYDIELLLPLVEAGCVLLTPTHRLARRIKREWDQRQMAGGQATWSPIRVHALEPWLEERWKQARREARVPAKTLLDADRARELWLAVIARERQESGEYSLLQPTAAADVASRARDHLIRWMVDADTPGVQAEFRLDQDCATFLQWLAAFNDCLAQAGLATRSDCMADLASATPARDQPRLVLLDFDDIPPLYRHCLEELSSELREIQTPASPGTGEAIAFTEKKLELQAVAHWAQRLNSTNPQETVGIVLADMQGDRTPMEYYLRSAFGCLGDDYNSLPVNFSTGISLDQAPVVRDALRILRTSAQAIPLGDIVGLLQSRFTSHDDGQSDLAVLFLQQLFEDGLEQVGATRLRTLARQVAAGEASGLAMGESLYQAFQLRLDRSRKLPSAWVEDICQVLDYWGWPGPGPLDSLEYQQVETWYKTLERYAAYDQVCQPMALREALQVLLRCCQAQVSQPQTADTHVQVLGPLEAAGLQFDHLWICGLQGSRWPPPPRPNAFIPIGIQKRADMPHATREREWLYAANLLDQYRRSSGELYASFCTQLDGVPELPSPLLTGMPLRHEPSQREAPPGWIEASRSRELERRNLDSVSGPGQEELPGIRGGSGILEDQANCPFRAFARRRLGLKPLDRPRFALSAAERGRILHDALYTLWGELGGSDALAGLEEDAAVAQAARAGIESVPAAVRQLVGSACLDLERQRLDSLLREWLAVERQRPRFTVVAREERFETEILGIPLTLRMDRIDELESGGHLVIDYKSGRNSLADWLGERPRSPQLPLYGVMTGNIVGLAYAEVRARECRYLGLGDSDVEGNPGIRPDLGKAISRYSDRDNWEDLVRDWERNLQGLAQAFLDGETAVNPLPGACDFCGLQALCRVDFPVTEVGQ